MRDEGGRRAEWIEGGGGGKEGAFWVFWKRPEEWGDVVADWVGFCFLVWVDVGVGVGGEG